MYLTASSCTNRSCGSLSTAPVKRDYTKIPNEFCDPDKVTTTGNFCQTMPYTNREGNPAGETVFVACDCSGHWPLGFYRQNEVYLTPGVSNNVSVYDQFLLAHQDYNIDQPVESTVADWCQNALGPYHESNNDGYDITS